MNQSSKSAPKNAQTHGVDYDVVVIGGAFCGSSAALLLRRWSPKARVLVVEPQERFWRKVGEATVEVSSIFLHRVLGLYDHLSRHHLPKHGLRFWFGDDDPARKLTEMTEVGVGELPRMPSFQLDRPVLDGHLLTLAEQEGAEIARPAKVKTVDLEGPHPVVTIAVDGQIKTARTRWVLDASGRHTFLGRRMRLHERVDEHPTSAIWGRWTNATDIDGIDTTGSDPLAPGLPHISAARRLGTNHFCGYGWWCWVIPLQRGATSIGIVWNKELVQLPGVNAEQRYRNFLASQPGLARIVEGATLDREDFLAYSHLPYRTSQYAGDGWAMVGDAASFLDPYYSPGLDHAAMSIFATTSLIRDQLAGKLDEAALAERLELHNDRFTRSYDRWLAALYLDKYEIMGDAELTSAAFRFDTATYYLGVVAPVDRDLANLEIPVFGGRNVGERIAFRTIRGFNRRLAKLAKKRQQLGLYGKRNLGWRQLGNAPSPGWPAVRMLLAGLSTWLRAERETFFAGLFPGRSGEPGRLAEPKPSRKRQRAEPAESVESVESVEAVESAETAAS